MMRAPDGAPKEKGVIYMILNFNFELDTRYIKHLPEISHYNHNYYELNLSAYGDYIITEKCNILYVECEDDCFESYYSLGYFDECGAFQKMWTWLDRFQEDL